MLTKINTKLITGHVRDVFQDLRRRIYKLDSVSVEFLREAEVGEEADIQM